MGNVEEGEPARIQQTSDYGDVPFLAMFAETREEWVPVGGYDDALDVWVVEGQPVATGNTLALATMTFTRTGGEGQDSD